MIEGKKFTGFVNMPLSENGSPDYCVCCINKMAIRCAWCGESINIGDPVTLCSPVHESFKVPDYAVKYGEGNQLVGCLRWGCGEAMCRSGFWMPPGIVERVPSPLELCLSGPTGSMVFVSNIADPKDIGTVFPMP